MADRSKEQVSYVMSRIRGKGTSLEIALGEELDRRGLSTYTRNDRNIYGTPDFVFHARKIAVFCDSEFWHGHDWEKAKSRLKTNLDYWIPKIERNIQRDKEVNEKLKLEGWTVLRFWGKQIQKNVGNCADEIEKFLRIPLPTPYRTIDLCSGIGGMRRAFERTGYYNNVLSAENDEIACATYEHLFGEKPYKDFANEEFKRVVERTPCEVLLFRCTDFPLNYVSNGKFTNSGKEYVFFHVIEIIKNTRPAAIFFDCDIRLAIHKKGKELFEIINILNKGLFYKVIGLEDENVNFNPKNFIRNSKFFGVPLNRNRVYIIGYDKERFSPDKLSALPNKLPDGRDGTIYKNINDIIEENIDSKFYLSSGYLNTVTKYTEKQKSKGKGFGYKILNLHESKKQFVDAPFSSVKSLIEKNLICDLREGIAGTKIKGKKTPLNNQGIRTITPAELGKLQGFENYAFIDEEGKDCFSFPESVSDSQKYVLLGNSSAIPVLEEMAKFIKKCFEKLE